ncbi:MAG: hypothetical protein WHV26_15280, partial [Spirochaetota bacterium]
MKSTFIIILITLFSTVSLATENNSMINYYKSKSKYIYIELEGESPYFSVTSKANIYDDELKELLKVKHIIKIIGLNNKNFTDKAFSYIKEMNQLKILSSVNAQLTDRGMEYIGELENLEELDISHTKVTDEGLKYLKGLKKLRTLIVSNTMIT